MKIKKLHIETVALAKDDWHITIWASFPGNDFARIIHTYDVKSFEEVITELENFMVFEVEFEEGNE